MFINFLLIVDDGNLILNILKIFSRLDFSIDYLPDLVFFVNFYPTRA